MNEIYARLKKETFKRNIFIGGFLLLLGVFMFVVGGMDLFSYLSASVDAFDIAVEGLQEDTYYTADINYLLDWYAEDDDGRYYISAAPAVNGDNVFMGVYIYNKDVDKAEQIADLTWEAIEADTDLQQEVFISGRGYVEAMGSEEEEYFDEYLMEALEEDDVSEYVCHKTLYMTPITKVISVSSVVVLLLALFLIIMGLILIIGFLAGSYKKSIQKTIIQNNIREAELVMDLMNGTHLGKVDIGSKYMMIYDKGGKLLPYKTLVWAYIYELKTRHMIYGIIPAGTTTTFSVQFYDVNGKNYEYSVKHRADGEAILDYLSKAAPYLIIGFSEQLKYTAANNYGQLVQSVNEERMRYESQMAPSMPSEPPMSDPAFSNEPFDPYIG